MPRFNRTWIEQFVHQPFSRAADDRDCRFNVSNRHLPQFSDASLLPGEALALHLLCRGLEDPSGMYERISDVDRLVQGWPQSL